MLPFSLTDGWSVVSDSKTIRFEAVWDGTHIIGTLIANRDEVVIVPVPGKALVMPLDVFEALTTRAVIAAHTTPGVDCG